MKTLDLVITIICFSILTFEVLYFIISYCVKKRKERILFVRNFKKGKCTVIYFSAIPLYLIGIMYNGETFLMSLFNAIGKIIGLVILKYDFSSIRPLMDADIFYTITIYYCSALVAINAILFALSIFSQRIWEFFQLIKLNISKKEKLFLFGYNHDNISIYQSATNYNKCIVGKMSDDDTFDLYSRKISYLQSDLSENSINRLFDKNYHKKRKAIFIINTKDEEKNIAFCQSLIKKINLLDDNKKNDIFDLFHFYVFGDHRYQTIYDDLVASSFGCLSYVNKYQMIAINFIDRYPFTKFMNQTQIDYEKSVIKKDININVSMIGFGKTNQQIFLTSVANNQFLTILNDETVLKKVNYHIFDKEKSQNNKNLNHSYYRFKNECSNLNEKDYLPLPSLPANENYYELDINNADFYNKLKEINQNTSDANFIIIAFGSDLENIDMAQKLIEKRQEWNLSNLIIFVKVRNFTKDQTLVEQDNCFFIGNEKKDVYNIKEIIDDKIFHMTQMRNELYKLESTIISDLKKEIDVNNIKNILVNYDLNVSDELIAKVIANKLEARPVEKNNLTDKLGEIVENLIKDKLKNEVTEEVLEKNHISANIDWFKNLSQLERESNLYACLSIRSKLNLMGLDYCPITDSTKDAISEKEYLEIYAKNDLPECFMEINSKKIINYTLNFKDSRRKIMAIHEHQRWNSFMISKGMIPASLEQILTEKVMKKGKEVYSNGKNYQLRRHGNLTTFAGLVTFRELVAKRDNSPEIDKDVIKYDYQLLDDVYWLLNKNGYKIIKL